MRTKFAQCLCGVLGVATVASVASAQITYVDQRRFHAIESSVTGDPQDGYFEAADFGPINNTIDAEATNSNGSMFVTSTLASTLDPDSLTASGSASSFLTNLISGFGLIEQTQVIDFSLCSDENVTISASADTVGGDAGFVDVRLLNVGTNTNVFRIVFDEVGSDTFDSTMTLPAGDYKLTCAMGGEQFPEVIDQETNYSFSMTVNAPDVCEADFNGDTIVDFFDLLDFLNAWFAGCP